MFTLLILAVLSVLRLDVVQGSTAEGLHIFSGSQPIGVDLSAASCAKRGVGWALNQQEMLTMKGLAWYYDWGIGSDAANASSKLDIEFVPMQWGHGGVEALTPDQLPPGARHLLGFNEPTHIHESGLMPQDAAELWPYLEAVADKLGLRLGAPSASPCGADCTVPDPFRWWDEFFFWCKGCRVDFLTTHYYACNVEWLASYLDQCRKYNLPIWLTEFACPNPTGSPVLTWRYMRNSLSLLDGHADIERFAWFSVDTSHFAWLGLSNSLVNLTTNRLTPLGELYLDCIPHSQHIKAAQPKNMPTKLAWALPQYLRTAFARAAGTAWRVYCLVTSTVSEGQHQQQHERGDQSSSLVPGGLQVPEQLTWSELCSECIAAVEHGQQGLAGLSGSQQRYCGERCGFWDRSPKAAQK